MSQAARDPVALATSTLFRRYLGIIEDQVDDALSHDPRLSLSNLAWLCQDAIKTIDEDHGLPIDKVSRWLGFVQGCLAMRGLIDVDQERDVSRPLFHEAYAAGGAEPPASRERP